MKAIVTVKLTRNIHHDPTHKVKGECPLTGNVCTDITGQHHSYIEEGPNLEYIILKAMGKYSHITRIEIIE